MGNPPVHHNTRHPVRCFTPLCFDLDGVCDVVLLSWYDMYIYLPPQVICVTYLPLMAYTILLRDLLAPIVEIVLNRTLDSQARNIMVSALVVLVR